MKKAGMAWSTQSSRGARSDALERLLKVCPDVLHALNAAGEADEVVLDAHLRPLLCPLVPVAARQQRRGRGVEAVSKRAAQQTWSRQVAVPRCRGRRSTRFLPSL